MAIRFSRSQFAWFPVAGWVLLGCVSTTAQAQVDTTSPASQTLDQQMETPPIELPPEPEASGGGAGTGRPELGIDVGSWTLSPALDIYAGYDTNVFATTAPTTMSPVTLWRPSFELASNWSNHALKLTAGAGFGFYPAAPTQNFQNYGLVLDGKLDIRTDFYLTGLVGFKRSTEALGTPNVSFAQAPTVVDSVPIELGLYQKFNRFFYQLKGAAVKYWYYDYSTITSIGLPAASRNRTEFVEALTLGYEIYDGVEIFISPGLNQRIYADTVNVAGQQRDSTGFNVNVGGSLTIGKRTSLNGAIGYTTQAYLSDGSSTSAGTFLLGGVWNGYEPLILRPSFSRSINESALSGYQNYISSVYGIDWTYDVHYPWKAVGGLSYNTADYSPAPGSGTPARTDYFFKASLGALYEVRPEYSIGPVYEYTQGWSSDVAAGGPQFNRSLFSLRLVIRR